MSNDSDALIREVEEELRRDQLKKLWDSYGTYIIGGVALLVAAIGGFNWWQASQQTAAEDAGSKFEQALTLTTEKKAAEADKLLASIAKGDVAGYSTLARLTQAGAAVSAGKTDDAVKAYEEAASSASDTLMKDFARLQLASLKIDSADWTEMQNRLKDLAEESNPWRYSARELLGVAALRAGKLDEARQTLAPLSADPKAPAALRERTGALMNLVLAAEAEKTAPKSIELEPAEGPPKPKTTGPLNLKSGSSTAGSAKPESALDRLRHGKN